MKKILMLTSLFCLSAHSAPKVSWLTYDLKNELPYNAQAFAALNHEEEVALAPMNDSFVHLAKALPGGLPTQRLYLDISYIVEKSLHITYTLDPLQKALESVVPKMNDLKEIIFIETQPKTEPSIVWRAKEAFQQVGLQPSLPTHSYLSILNAERSPLGLPTLTVSAEYSSLGAPHCFHA